MFDNNDRILAFKMLYKNTRDVRIMTVYRYVAKMPNKEVSEYVEYTLFQKCVKRTVVR